MQIRHMHFEEHAMGIPLASLRILRDSLAFGYAHRLALVHIPTDEISCGFLIINSDTQSATFTGDGFRIDGQGEGAAAYRSATALLAIFSITPVIWKEVINFAPVAKLLGEGKMQLASNTASQLLLPIAHSFNDSSFIVPFKQKADYARMHCSYLYENL